MSTTTFFKWKKHVQPINIPTKYEQIFADEKTQITYIYPTFGIGQSSWAAQCLVTSLKWMFLTFLNITLTLMCFHTDGTNNVRQWHVGCSSHRIKLQLRNQNQHNWRCSLSCIWHIAYHHDSAKISMAHGLQSIIPTKNHCGFSCPGILKSGVFSIDDRAFWNFESTALQHSIKNIVIVWIHVPYHPMFLVLRMCFCSVTGVCFVHLLFHWCFVIFVDSKIKNNNNPRYPNTCWEAIWTPKPIPKTPFTSGMTGCLGNDTVQPKTFDMSLWSLRLSCHLDVANHHRDVLVGKLPAR